MRAHRGRACARSVTRAASRRFFRAHQVDDAVDTGKAFVLHGHGQQVQASRQVRDRKRDVAVRARVAQDLSLAALARSFVPKSDEIAGGAR
jgi:hypothetical protein